MRTTAENLGEILKNGFIVNRESTKHKKKFKFNIFQRPVTHTDFFQLLAKCSDIQLNMYECYRWSHNSFVSNYTQKQMSSIKLIVRSRSQVAIESNNGWLTSLNLDPVKFFEMYDWFTPELFSTDFGELRHDSKYYQNN